MEIEYRNQTLKRMAQDAREDGGYAQSVVTVYRKRIQLITAAPDERDFYKLKSLHYEKLKGNRSHQRSMRINRQLRLILEIKSMKQEQVVRIISIEDYHKKKGRKK